jgi:hypothetical protein
MPNIKSLKISRDFEQIKGAKRKSGFLTTQLLMPEMLNKLFLANKYFMI